jgi:hypothetical protein
MSRPPVEYPNREPHSDPTVADVATPPPKNAMPCPSCHHDNQPDHRFCTQCGTRLATGCPSCGAPVAVDEIFCGGCGAALTIRGQTTPPPPAHAPIFSEKIRQATTAVEGEHKQVTVLFVDVAGSMELTEHLDPEAWSEIMQRFFRIFSDGIQRFGNSTSRSSSSAGRSFLGRGMSHRKGSQRRPPRWCR